MNPPRPVPIDVISIQSQVVYGRVGHNAALPALHAFGLRTAAVPTTLLSNTPHYPSVHGGVVPNAWLAGWLDDLEARGLAARARVVQVGFLGAPAQARVVADWWSRLHRRHPHLRLHVDPVIGDHDHGHYTADGMTEAWRALLLPQAHGLVPNRFELEQLTGRRLSGLDDCRAAARALLRGPTEWVVVTSAQPDPLGATVQTLLETQDGLSATVDQPRVPCAAKGAGDYFAARLTGHLLQDTPPHRRCRRPGPDGAGEACARAVMRACGDTTQVLRRTRELGWEELAVDAAPAGCGVPA